MDSKLENGNRIKKTSYDNVIEKKKIPHKLVCDNWFHYRPISLMIWPVNTD